MALELNEKSFKTRKEFYDAYLATEHWASLRNKVLDQRGRVCENCELRPMELHVHHLFYRNLYNVKVKDLMILCFECHKKVHELLDSKRIIYSKGESREIRRNLTLDALKGRFSKPKIVVKKAIKSKKTASTKKKSGYAPAKIKWDKASEEERLKQYWSGDAMSRVWIRFRERQRKREEKRLLEESHKSKRDRRRETWERLYKYKKDI